MKRLVTLFLGLILMSCGGSDNPSEAQAREDISKIVSAGTENKVNLTSFVKTDGLAKDESGVFLYVMEFKGEVKFLEETFSDLDIPLSSSRSIGGFLEIRNDINPEYFPNHTHIKANTSYNIKGAVQYIKKENGWKLKDLVMKVDK